MGNEESLSQDKLIENLTEEEFYHKFYKGNDLNFKEENHFQLSLAKLKYFLITNPDFFENLDDVTGYLINNQEIEKPFPAEIMKPYFQKCQISHNLSKMRSIQLPHSNFSLKPDSNSFIFKAMLLLFHYMYYLEFDEENCSLCLKDLSLLSIGPNMTPPSSELLISDNSFVGLAPAQNISVHGLTCSGRSLFALGNGTKIIAFPILENGALLVPVSKDLIENSLNLEIVACPKVLKLFSKNILNQAKEINIIESSVFNDDDFSYINKLNADNGVLHVSDGATIVSISSDFSATVYSDYNGKMQPIHTCILHASGRIVSEEYEELLTMEMLTSFPCETNGVFVSFFINTHGTSYICRQFSLLTGEHVGDTNIDIGVKIMSITLDAMHNIHWVAVAENEGVLIKGYKYVGVSDPYIYNIRVPTIEKKCNNAEKLLGGIIFNLMGSLGRQVSPGFLLSSSEEFLGLISDILGMMNLQTPNKKVELTENVLKAFILVVTVNMKLFENNKRVLNQLRYLLSRFPNVWGSSAFLSDIVVLLAYSFDSIMSTELIQLLLIITKSVNDQMFEKLILEISNSKFLSRVPTATNNPLSNLIISNKPISGIHHNDYSLLLVQQKVLVREAMNQLRNDTFSSITIFKANLKASTPLDFLSEYMQVLINVFTSKINQISTVEEMTESLIYKLYNNFIYLILGMSESHAIAQMALPLLSVVASSLLAASKRIDDHQKHIFEQLFLDTGFTFGIFTATLIKGGNFSEFEENHKWLIKPNMDMSDVVNLSDLTSAPEELQVTVEEIQQIYKFWKPAINRRLKPEVITLDRHILSIYIKAADIRSYINDSLQKKKVNPEIRPFLDNLLRIRNHFITLQRENKSTENIINKCNLLLKMKMLFQKDDDAAKKISDFICSADTPDEIIHFITNQKIRVKLINIGFSLLQNIYLQKIDNKDFYYIVSYALSSIDSMDNLSAMSKNEERSHVVIENFISMAIKIVDPKLMLVLYRMLKSNVLNEEKTGEIIRPFFQELMENTKNTKDLVLCMPFISLIPGASDFLFSLLDHPEKISPIHLFLIERAIKTSKKCSKDNLKKLISFARNCAGNKLRNALRAVEVALRFVESHGKYKSGALVYLMEILGKNYVSCNNLEQNCELVALFRRILLEKDELSSMTDVIIHSITPEDSKPYQIAAVFGILGGNIEVNKSIGKVAIKESMQREKKCVLVKSFDTEFSLDLPITSQTEEVANNGNKEIINLPEVPFSIEMFPDFNYVIAFFNKCTACQDMIENVLYLTSLSEYLNDAENVNKFVRSNVFKDFISVANTTNPFDSIHLINTKIEHICASATLEDIDDFGQMIVPDFNGTILLSKPFNSQAKVYINIVSKGLFNGMIGFVDDDLSYSMNHRLVCLEDKASKIEVFWKAGKFTFGKKSYNYTTKSKNIRAIIVPQSIDNLESVKLTSPKSSKQKVSNATASLIGYDHPLNIVRRETLSTVFSEVNNLNEKQLLDILRGTKEIPKWKQVIDTKFDQIGRAQIPQNNLQISPINATKMSPSLKDSVLSQLFAHLYSQWLTVIMTKVIANHPNVSLPQEFKTRLFTILLTILEPFNINDLLNNKLPYSLTKSVINMHSETNVINYDLTNACKQALKHLSKDENVIKSFVDYIIDVIADERVHYLSIPQVPALHYPVNSTNGFVSFDGSAYGANALVISYPLFNVCATSEQMMKIVEGSKTSYTVPEFVSSTYPITALCVSNHYTSWTIGTPFEIILLLKTLFAINNKGKDPLFVRKALIDLLICQSPFIFPFLEDMFSTTMAEFIKISTRKSVPYLKMLVMLGSFLDHYKSLNSTAFYTFFVQESNFLTSPFISLIYPYFPELTGNNSERDENLPNSISITMENLEFKPNEDKVALLFQKYLNIVKKYTQISLFPFYDVFPLWTAILVFENQNMVSSKQYEIIKLSDTSFCVSNPREKPISVRITPLVDLPSDFCLMTSEQSDFNDSDFTPASDIPTTITTSSKAFYFAVISDEQFSVDLLEVNVEVFGEPDTTVSISMRDVHDIFVSDMNDFVFKWTDEMTQRLASIIPAENLSGSDFTSILGYCSNTKMFRGVSDRVVKLYALFIHRFNYIVIHHKNKIKASHINSISSFISGKTTTTAFLRAVKISDGSKPSFTFDRHRAHSDILERRETSNSMIAQFSQKISGMDMKRLQANGIPWSVHFAGEAAVDAGGPGRELFSELAASIFQPTSGLFILSPNGQNHSGEFADVYVPCSSNNSKLRIYYSIGVFLGIVIRCGFHQDVPFAPFIWDFLAGETIQEHNILQIDSQLRKQFERLQAYRNLPSFSEKCHETWNFVSWKGKLFCAKGTRHNPDPVLASQVDDFIESYIQFRINEIRPALYNMRKGFYDNIGFSSHPMMCARVISLLVQGSNEITVKQLRSLVRYNHQLEIIFWPAVNRFTNEQRSKLLKFITGLTKIPNKQVDSNFYIEIEITSDSPDSLPRAATCFKRLYLPQYPNAKVAYNKIAYAIEVCDTMEKC